MPRLPQLVVNRLVEEWLAAGNRVTICPPAPAKPEMWDILENLRRRMPAEPKEQAPTGPKELLFSPEREAVLRQMWPTSATADAIQTALNELPGPWLTIAQIGSKAGTRGIRRPVGHPRGYHAHRRCAEAEAAD